MLLRFLPLLAGILPLVAMFGALWLGISNEVIKSCVPFIDGCVSISATGRKPPGSFLFRAIMLPQAALLAAVWILTVQWLRSLHGELSRSLALTILLSGLLGALALVIYVTFLGTKEPVYEFMRRTGIYFGFLGLAVAQLATALALLRVARLKKLGNLMGMANIMLRLCIATFALGIIIFIVKPMLDDPDPMENRIEWIAAILMQSYFFFLYAAWSKTSFTLTASTNAD